MSSTELMVIDERQTDIEVVVLVTSSLVLEFLISKSCG